MRINRRARREARRLYRACVVSGLLDEGRARQVVERVAGARRRGGLAILSHFQRLVSLDRALHSAVVESATPLPPDLRASVEAGVVRAYGPGVSTSFADNPALIGGMRVKIGSDVYDGSVRAALLTLEERF
ncbi:MAG TPA: F0F1 ATP synthase subunit delta [Vicinamibacteria bacterium]|nr:F0F1 ATP synthase subunit delta [Vicinamibacteria bacterium]HXK10428.1 F0F1 ATP synthase subunit delta [Vicinamibacteria bacterium]